MMSKKKAKERGPQKTQALHQVALHHLQVMMKASLRLQKKLRDKKD
jgi:hypothetical protein